MCKRAGRNKVYAGKRTCSQGSQGDATRSLRFITSPDELHGFFKQGQREVIKHDPVYAAMRDHTFYFIKVPGLDLDPQVKLVCFEVTMRPGNGRFYPACKINMVQVWMPTRLPAHQTYTLM